MILNLHVALFSFLIRRPPTSTLFPYTTLSDLPEIQPLLADPLVQRQYAMHLTRAAEAWSEQPGDAAVSIAILDEGVEDRKSTRLNSSHGYISYAVFCLKKKK